MHPCLRAVILAAQENGGPLLSDKIDVDQAATAQLETQPPAEASARPMGVEGPGGAAGEEGEVIVWAGDADIGERRGPDLGQEGEEGDGCVDKVVVDRVVVRTELP
jgi:hypothetical protein